MHKIMKPFDQYEIDGATNQEILMETYNFVNTIR